MQTVGIIQTIMESKYNIAIRRGFQRDFPHKFWLQPKVRFNFRGKISTVFAKTFSVDSDCLKWTNQKFSSVAAEKPEVVFRSGFRCRRRSFSIDSVCLRFTQSVSNIFQCSGGKPEVVSINGFWCQRQCGSKRKSTKLS